MKKCDAIGVTMSSIKTEYDFYVGEILYHFFFYPVSGCQVALFKILAINGKRITFVQVKTQRGESSFCFSSFKAYLNACICDDASYEADEAARVGDILHGEIVTFKGGVHPHIQTGEKAVFYGSCEDKTYWGWFGFCEHYGLDEE